MWLHRAGRSAKCAELRHPYNLTLHSTLMGLPHRPDKKRNGRDIWIKNVLNGWTDNGRKDNWLVCKG